MNAINDISVVYVVYVVVGEFVPVYIFFSSNFYCKIIFGGNKAEKTAALGEKEKKIVVKIK